jgi:hypothetical protein
LTTSIPLFSQVKTISFREFELDNNLMYNLSLGKKGIVIFGETEPGLWHFQLIDTNLNDVRFWEVRTPKYTQLKEYSFVEKINSVVVWQMVNTRKYSLITFNTDSLNIHYKTIEIPQKTYITGSMSVVNDELWFPAGTRKSEFIYRIRPTTGTMDLIPLVTSIIKTKPRILSIQDFKNDEVAVSFIQGYNRRRELEVSIYNASGHILKPSLLGSLNTEQKQLLRDAKVTRLDSGDYSITGMFSKSRNSTINKGVFFARYAQGKIGFLSFFNYSDFAHFDDYKNKNIWQDYFNQVYLSYSRYFLMRNAAFAKLAIQHDAVLTQSGVVFIAEYYFPTYIIQQQLAAGVLTGNYNNTRRVFDGYQYTHAMAVGISPVGEKLFDACIPLYAPYKPFTPITFLKVSHDSQSIKLVHTSGRRVFSASIENLETKYYDWTVTHNIPENQRERWTFSNAIWCFDNHYFILEKQRIKEKGSLLGKGTTHCYGSIITVN